MYYKTAGYLLAIGALLVGLTLILHPAGGSIEYLVKIKSSLMISHTIAVLSIPCMMFGFKRLAEILDNTSRIAHLGYIISCIGLLSALLAGVLNGWVLPQFLSYNVQHNMPVETIKVVRSYAYSLNESFTYLFAGAMVLAISLWSILMIKNKTSLFKPALGYYGLICSLFILLAIIIQINIVKVWTFRILALGIILWVAWAAWSMVGTNKTQHSPPSF